LEKIKINKLNLFNKFKNFNEENLLTIINKVPEKIGITKNKSNINRKPQISPVIKGDVDEILNKLSKMPNLSEKEKMLLQKPNITNKPKSRKSHTI
jgi:thiamine pyrophosphate-dependent acetolactate synthase large subunit-like protein